MPLAHNLNKVTKNVAKSTAAMHIKGRKFKQLNRATLRDQRITTKKQKSLEQKENELAFLFFVQKLINDDEDFKTYKTFTLKDIQAFIELFVSRYDDELKQLKKDRRPGRPQTTRQLNLEEVVKHENQVYDTGYRAPDLTTRETVEFLRLWNGTTGGTTVMKFVYVSRTTTELPTKDISI